ncbi:MAG TPA: ATP-binding protein [Pseudogracilibacillus sp.]|nr:ATP-binding protein [Pseudogracilibacillus sp.]
MKYFLSESIEERVLGTFICEFCSKEVIQKELTIPSGPEKGEKFIANYNCICENKRLAREALQLRRARQRGRKEQKFAMHSMLNASLTKATFSSFEAESEMLLDTKEQLMTYVENFDPVESDSLLLVGSTGVGKSHLAVSVAKSLMGKGYQALFLSVPKLFTKIKQTYNSDMAFNEADILALIEAVDLFVLDDVGTEYMKKNTGDSWADSKLFEILDSRAGKPTIYTTNLDGDELRVRMTERNYSRMMDRVSIFHLYDEDYRQKGANDNGEGFIWDEKCHGL